MTVDLTRLNFLSTLNYMKRDAVLSGTTTLTLGGFQAYSTYTVTHNYGYIPFFQVYAELSSDGVLWAGEKVNAFTESTSGSTPTDPTLLSWSDTTTLTIKLYNDTSPTATGTRNVYWIIYKDYGTT